MKDDDFRDWRRDEELPRDPGAGEDVGAVGPSLEAAPDESSLMPEPGTLRAQHAALPPGPAGVRAQTIYCPNCQYNLTGATIGMACPECGMIVGSGLLGIGTNRPASGKAVASLVLGIVSILGCFFYAVPSMICGPLALIFSRQAKGQVLRGEVNPSSEGMAMAGFVCGLIGTIIGGVVWLVIGGIIAAAVVSGW